MTTKDWIVLAAVAVVAGAAGAGVTMWSTEHQSESGEETEALAPTTVAGSGSAAGSAKITEDSARVLALAQVPGGKVEGGELETEGGKLLYSFDIKIAGKSGVEEIHISALTGELLSHEHETDAAEAAEKEKEPVKPKKGGQ
jgi:uncharacterized membrane protein YkoI